MYIHRVTSRSIVLKGGLGAWLPEIQLIYLKLSFLGGGQASETTLKHDVCICVTQGLDVHRYRTQQVIAIGLYEMEEDDKKVSINLI